MDFSIEEVDVRAAWAELEPLLQGIIDYHRPIDPRVLREDWAPRMLELMADSENVTLLAREHHGKPIAFLNGRLIRDEGIFEEALAYVNNAFVVEDWRGRGVASELLRVFEVWCATRGVDEISLSVQEGNEAGLAFWSARGFQPESRTLRKRLGAAS